MARSRYDDRHDRYDRRDDRDRGRRRSVFRSRYADDEERRGCSLVSIGVLALLAYALTIGLSFLPGFTDQVRTRLERALDRPLKLERAHLDHRLDIVARDLAWSAGTDELEAANIKRLRLRWSLLDSARAGGLVFNRIEADELTGVVGVPSSSYEQSPRPLAELLSHIGTKFGLVSQRRTTTIRDGRLNWSEPNRDATYLNWQDFELKSMPLAKGDVPRDYVYFTTVTHKPGAELGTALEGEFFVLGGDTNQAFRVRLIESADTP